MEIKIFELLDLGFMMGNMRADRTNRMQILLKLLLLQENNIFIRLVKDGGNK